MLISRQAPPTNPPIPPGTTLTRTFTCPPAINIQDIVYESGADTVDLADRTVEATAPAVGVVISKSNPTTCVVQWGGPCTGFVGLTPAATYYLGLVGAPTNTVAGFVAGNVVQPIGVALNATTLLLQMTRDYTVIA